MIHTLLARFFPAPDGGTTDLSIGFEGLSGGWAFFLLVLLGALIVWGYHRGAPALSRSRRNLLAGLRLVGTGILLLLLVRPVLLLTLNEPVRERLVVLLDATRSMEIRDQRVTKEDLNRAAIATGLSAPSSPITADPPGGMTPWKEATRAALLKALAGNSQLSLWNRLHEKADLEFYRFGRGASRLSAIGTGEPIPPAQAEAYFGALKYDEEATALGESLRQVLNEIRGQPIAGVLIVTDGANNSGLPPVEIAALAKTDGIPLFLYGVGIEGPKDIAIREVTGPRGAFVRERAEFAVRVHAPGFTGQAATLQLKVNGAIVDEQKVTLDGDGETEYRLSYEPQEQGIAAVEASLTPLEGEASTDNNSATTRIRVLDSQVKVLFLEQEPRWDFRYLLSTLQRDRRINVQCVLFDGGADLADEEGSPFLKDFPADPAALASNEILILGDVDPLALGKERMKAIADWVSELGGGLIVLAGPKNNPFRYAGTPLEPLLPIQLDPALTEEQFGQRSREPIPLKLTTQGEYSPLLRLAEDTLENRQIWNTFPGVRWTARTAGARPTAQVFLVDTNPDHAVGGRPNPVLAQQPYGQGTVMYFGFDETYRWRSRLGEKFYAQIWNQIIQNFSLERQLGASATTQITSDRPEYQVGDKVVISGKILTRSFAPLEEATVPGTLVFRGNEEGAREEPSEMRLVAVPDQSGLYQMEFTASKPGEYRFFPLRDPRAIVRFTVSSPKLEQTETAMNASLLQAMADASGGKFFREESLHALPDLLAGRAATVPTFKKRELYYSPWWMVALMILACGEWLLRRLWQLK